MDSLFCYSSNHIRQFRVRGVRISLQLAAFRMTHTSILLTNMTMETILIPTRTPSRAWTTFEYVL